MESPSCIFLIWYISYIFADAGLYLQEFYGEKYFLVRPLYYTKASDKWCFFFATFTLCILATIWLDAAATAATILVLLRVLPSFST